jgi:hypothetical protein
VIVGMTISLDGFVGDQNGNAEERSPRRGPSWSSATSYGVSTVYLAAAISPQEGNWMPPQGGVQG